MKLGQQLARDRALRDAAWEVVSEDVTWLQADLDHRSVGGRVADLMGRKALTLAEVSLEAVKRNKLALGATAIAAGLWLSRRQIMAAGKHVRNRIASASTNAKEEQTGE